MIDLNPNCDNNVWYNNVGSPIRAASNDLRSDSRRIEARPERVHQTSK